MDLRLKKEAWLHLPEDYNWRLEAPHLRKTPEKPRKEIRSFGFRVPVSTNTVVRPKTTNYYFGDPKFKPPGKYKVISDGTRTNAVNQIATGTATIKPRESTPAGRLEDMKAIEYFGQ